MSYQLKWTLFPDQMFLWLQAKEKGYLPNPTIRIKQTYKYTIQNM